MNRPGLIGGSMCGCPVFMQAVFERFRHVIGCGHVSGLVLRREPMPRAVMEIRGIRCISTRRARGSWSLIAFPDPDQTDRLPLTLVDLLTCPTIRLLARDRLIKSPL